LGLPFAAGQRILASDLNLATQQAAWTSYTPTWTSSATQPAIANGTIVGYYAKVGRLVTAKILVQTGSLSTYGTGFYSFSLPFAAATTSIPNGAFAHSGAISVQNNGGTFYAANAIILQSSPSVTNGILNANGNFLGATVPVTFTGANTQFQCTVTYESTL